MSERDRASARHKIFELVSVIIDGQGTRAHLLNISATTITMDPDTPTRTNGGTRPP